MRLNKEKSKLITGIVTLPLVGGTSVDGLTTSDKEKGNGIKVVNPTYLNYHNKY